MQEVMVKGTTVDNRELQGLSSYQVYFAVAALLVTRYVQQFQAWHRRTYMLSMGKEKLFPGEIVQCLSRPYP